MHRAFAMLSAVPLLLVAACGGDDAAPSAGPAPSTATAADAATAAMDGASSDVPAPDSGVAPAAPGQGVVRIDGVEHRDDVFGRCEISPEGYSFAIEGFTTFSATTNGGAYTALGADGWINVALDDGNVIALYREDDPAWLLEDGALQFRGEAERISADQVPGEGTVVPFSISVACP